MLLRDKVVLVSGIGPGLGIELALEAARQGAHLVIAARTQSRLDEASEAIAALGLNTQVLAQSTDIANPQQCEALVASAEARFGRIDALINSAYVPGQFTPIDQAPLSDWRNTMEVNFFGTMQLTLATVPLMKRNGGGNIVMINSMITRRPMFTQGGYGASKAALSSATQHLALELGPDNIRVNSCHMGWMWGKAVQDFVEGEAARTGASVESLKNEIASRIPLRIIPHSADCAKAAIFLASDYSCVITGSILDVNGGEYLPS